MVWCLEHYTLQVANGKLPEFHRNVFAAAVCAKCMMRWAFSTFSVTKRTLTKHKNYWNDLILRWTVTVRHWLAIAKLPKNDVYKCWFRTYELATRTTGICMTDKIFPAPPTLMDVVPKHKKQIKTKTMAKNFALNLT